MRVVISAGGTGGHIYPALAVINKIKEKEPQSEFLYIGTHNRMEKDIVPQYHIPYEAIEIYGFNRRHLHKNFKTIACFYKSYRRCKKLIEKFRPDIVIGIGGYVTAPVLLAGHKLHYKTMIHEQNSVPGKSNAFLSKYADLIAVSFASTLKDFPQEKTIFTGNPCSEDALKVIPMDKRELGLSPHKKLVYIVMGSLGSSKVTELLVHMLSLFNGKEYEVLFVTGKEFYETISKNKFPSNVKLVPYLEKQTRIMKQADLIVTRCGATTLSEIIALQVPAILIPSPYVANNHQYKNAMDLVAKKAAILLEEKDLKGDILVRKIDQLFKSPSQLMDMKSNLRPFMVPNCATKIYEAIKKTIDGK